jgi:FkbM family methyltransferase
MSTIAKKGEVHTFEPSPNIFPYLAVNNQQQMHVNNIALSNTSGEMTFFNTINSGESGASTLHKERLTLDARHIYTEQRIQTQTLDQYTQTHTHPTIIKLDVEGAESEVIEGGIKTLQENKPTLIMEVWRGDKGDHFHKKALNLLKKLGYTPHILTIDGNLKKSTFDHFPIYTKLEKDFDNVVFK